MSVKITSRPLAKNIRGSWRDISGLANEVDSCLKFAPQELTLIQQALARVNIGLGDAATKNVGVSGGVASYDDARLTNSRNPLSHASTHATGGSDPITAGSIGAFPITGGTISGAVTINNSLTANSLSTSGNTTINGYASFPTSLTTGWPTTGSNFGNRYGLASMTQDSAILNIGSTGTVGIGGVSNPAYTIGGDIFWSRYAAGEWQAGSLSNNALGSVRALNFTASGVLTLPGATNSLQFSGAPYTTCLTKNTSDGNVYIGIVGNNTNRIGLSPGGQAVILGSGGYFGFSGTNLDASQAVTTRISQLNSNTVQIGTTANNALGNLACAAVTASSQIQVGTSIASSRFTEGNSYDSNGLKLTRADNLGVYRAFEAGIIAGRTAVYGYDGGGYFFKASSSELMTTAPMTCTSIAASGTVNANLYQGATSTVMTYMGSAYGVGLIGSIYNYSQGYTSGGPRFCTDYQGRVETTQPGYFGWAPGADASAVARTRLSEASAGVVQVGTTSNNADGSLIAKSIGFSSVSSNQGDIGWNNTTLDRWASDRKMTYIGGTLVMDSYANTCTIPIPLTQGYQSSSSDPTTTDIPLSRIRGWKNTTNGELRLWANDGGTLKSVLLS